MKFMSTWTALPGALPEAVSRFLAGEAAPSEPDVKILGRWHSIDLSSGFTLYESDNPASMYKGAAKWADLLEINTVVVVEDAEAGAALASVFKK